MTEIIHDNTFQTFPMIISLVQEKSEAPHLRWTSISTNLRACDHAGDKVAFVFLLPLNILLIPLEIIRYLFIALFYCCCNRKKEHLAIEAPEKSATDAALEEGGGAGQPIITQAMYGRLQADYATVSAQNRKFQLMLSLCNRALEKGADLRQTVLEECNDPKWADDARPADGPAPMADLGLVTHSVTLLGPDFTCGDDVCGPSPTFTWEEYAQLLGDRTDTPEAVKIIEKVVQGKAMIEDLDSSLLGETERQVIAMERLHDEPSHGTQTLVSLVCRPDEGNVIRLGRQEIDLIREKYPALFHLFLVNSNFAEKNPARLDITPEDMGLLSQHSGGKIALVEMDPPANEAIDPSMYFELELNGLETLEEYEAFFNDPNDEVVKSLLRQL